MQIPAGPPPADPGLLARLLEVYLPRRHCMNYETGLIAVHVVGDALIAAAFFSIPVTVVYFLRRRPDLPHTWLFVLFAGFSAACGLTHVFDVLAIWRPVYWVDGLVKLATGLVAVAAAGVLWPLLPRALRLPSPAQLQRVNRDLEQEVGDRRRAEAEQQRLRDELESRVRERTEELAAANRALKAEIAARRRAEVERQHLLESERWARGEAERVNRMKDEFLASLSHELRTPLNAILGWSQLLRHKGVPDEVGRGLEIIERNAQVQTQLVEDLLDMSRIISGKVRLDVQDVDLARLTQSALETVRPAAQAKGVRLETAFAAGLGTVRGDSARLQQVLWNLISNAVKFTPRDGRVRLAAARDELGVRIEVTDTGKGIDPQFLPFLFQRFRQGDASATRQHKGLGLGLAIVKHLVELHGGTVEARSEGEGRGSTFLVQLPLRAAIEQEEDRPRPEADATDLRGVRVLVVDDDEDARELVRRLLEERGATVELVADAGDALARLRADPPDVLLSDIGMPEQDGYRLIRRIRQLPPEEGGQLPAAALTAFARPEDRMRALIAGYQIHLTKPVQPAELLAVVAGLAGLRDRDEDGT